MATKKTFVIIDGNALLHRAWHAIPPLTAPDGRVVNAAYGFTNVVENVRKEMQPDYIAVAWDLPGETFRHAEFEDYKGTREKKEQELYDQIDYIQDILTAYGIPSLSAKGFEADDILGTLAKTYGSKPDMRVKILTGDLDTLQIVDKNVESVVFVKGLSQTKRYDEAAVRERYGLEPEQLIDLKALMGDASDNIPGITGIGKKTATDLLAEYSSIEGIFDAIESGKVKDSVAKKLKGKESEVAKMRRLVTIVNDVKLKGFTLEKAKVEDPDRAALTEQFRALGFRGLLAKYGGGVVEAATKRKKSKTVAVGSLSDLASGTLYLSFIKKEEDLFGATLADVIISDGKVQTVFVNPTEAQMRDILDVLNGAKLIVGHDVKALMHTIGEIKTPIFDTMIASYLLAAHTRDFDLKTVAWEFAKVRLSENAAADDQLDAIIALHKTLAKGLEKDHMTRLAEEIEMPLIRVLYLMEREGIEVDKKRLAELSREFERELSERTRKIYALAGKEFNINSPSQLADVLFVTLGLPTKGIKKTKSGFSTAASELEKLWEQHKIIALISEYREFAKLKSTYIDALPKLIGRDGRIHTSFNQTVAATGRLSSSDPNLQNIPIRTELGNEIRKAFVAKEGSVLISCDYSQFELRLAAAFAKDKAFTQAFRDGADIHAAVAAEILEKEIEDVSKAERRAAKAINFGILYGMGPRNLARSTGLSQDQAKEFIEKYFDLHPGIAEYVELMKKQAHREGYVETLFGRRRHLPDIHSGVHMLVAAAERMAVNMPIQGTQADLVKVAMLELQKWIETSDAPVKMLLQVHDELVFEVPRSEAESAMMDIQDIMESVWKDDVPLLVNVGIGTSWGALKEWVKA